jgi:lipopolysaccharide heptosyltransferase III
VKGPLVKGPQIKGMTAQPPNAGLNTTVGQTLNPPLNPNAPSSLLSNLPRNANVLVIRLRSVGDVVLTLPALQALNDWRPDLRIHMLVEPLCAPLVEGHPAISEVIVLRKFWDIVRQLRRRRFAMAFNMHGGPTSAFLTRLSGAPVRVCWAQRQFSSFYNVQVPIDFPVAGRTEMHTAEHRLQQFLWTGLPEKPLPAARVYVDPNASDVVRQKMAEQGIKSGEPYAVLRPGASQANKRWPVERFAAVARWLRETHGMATVVNLGPGDEPIARAVREHFASVGRIVDSLDLPGLIALLAGSSFFLGNDTGPTHIAAALGIKSVVIFGASDSRVWSPWKTEYRLVENPFPCTQCPNGWCESLAASQCISYITVEQVRQACEALLTQNRTAGPSLLHPSARKPGAR